MSLVVPTGAAPNDSLLDALDLGDFTWVPNIIEFVTSPSYLNRPSLYPRQATLLKIIFLQDHLFTDYDHAVIEEWSKGFTLDHVRRVEDDDSDLVTLSYAGGWGIPPDIYDRIAYLKSEGHRWFSVVLAVQGRRSGKGHIGALCGAYVLYNYLCLPDPRWWFSVDRDKRLASQVFAGKKAQARDNQWRDIANVVMGAPCFQRFLSKPLTDTLTINSKRDLLDGIIGQRVETTLDRASFEIAAKEATTMAARGPASFMQFYDEGAHMVATGVSRSMGEVWETATPSLDQFKPWGFVYSGSSPWTMDGKFYELCQQTLTVEADTLEPVYPEQFMVQLESWDIYRDWELTRNGDFVLAPEHAAHATEYQLGDIEVSIPPPEAVAPAIYAYPLRKAIQVYDKAAQRKERANPDTFRVEYRAQWATGLDTYFPAAHVDRMFQPWNGVPLTLARSGSPTETYVIHCDPGQTGSNFGVAVAHRVPDPDGHPIPHVVFDFIHGYQQFDFPSGEMDYLAIEEELGELMDGFLPVDVTFDQWNSISMIQRLAQRSRQTFKPARVYERTATAPVNWRTAETTKVALSLNRVHAPYHELAELEFKFLRKLPGDKVDHPMTGPCTTKDVYDAMSVCIVKLIGQDVAMAYGDAFSALRVAGGMPGEGAPMIDGVMLPGAPGASPADQIAKLNQERMMQRRQGMSPLAPRPGSRRYR